MAATDNGIRLRQLSPEAATFSTPDTDQAVQIDTAGDEAPITLQTAGDGSGAGVEPDVILQTTGDAADVKLLTSGAFSNIDLATSDADGDINVSGGNDTTIHAGAVAGTVDTNLNLMASPGTGTGRINIGVDTVVAPVTGNVQIKSGDAPGGGGSGGDILLQSPVGKVDLYSAADDVDVRAPAGAVDIDGQFVDIDGQSVTAHATVSVTIDGAAGATYESSGGDVTVHADDDVTIRSDGSGGAPNINLQHGSTGNGLIVFCQPVLECFTRDEDLTSYTFPSTWATSANHSEDTLGLGNSDVAQWFFKLPFGCQINQVKVFLSCGSSGQDIAFSLMQHAVGYSDAQEIVGGADGTITISTTDDVDVMLEGDGSTPNVAVAYDAGDGVWGSGATKRLKDNTGSVESRSAGSGSDDDVWFESRYSLTIACSASQTATIKRIEVACWSKAQYP